MANKGHSQETAMISAFIKVAGQTLILSGRLITVFLKIHHQFLPIYIFLM